MPVERVATVDGTDVLEVLLRTQAGAQARILTWGAVIRDLLVPSRSGRQRVVLGLERLEDYIAHSPYFGAVVGRYGNRIGQARFTLAGRTFALDVNEGGRHQLHGGSRGFGTRLWTLLDHGPDRATLGLVSADGDMGYPGRLVAWCTYAFREPATLRIALEATCDAPTPVNLTTHSYFNLDSGDDIASHQLMIAADYVTPTDQELIPTGEIRAVASTPYDFSSLRPIGPAGERVRYDINYVLRGAAGRPDGAPAPAPSGSAAGDPGLAPAERLAHAATLLSPASGVSMELWTTEPGLQFYDGHLIDIPVPGLGGARYGPHAGLCLEPQRFPDGPNKAHFPPCILRPGTVSRQISELRFATA